MEWKRSHKNQGPRAKRRREIALAHLEHKLVYNKVAPNDTPDHLTEPQVKRIHKEIDILKTRI